MVYACAIGHAPEHRCFPILGELLLRPIDISLVNIVTGHGGADRIDVGCGKGQIFGFPDGKGGCPMAST